MYKAMIVEDEVYARAWLRAKIGWEALGLTLSEEAENGRAGLDGYARSFPDVILTDLRMPVMDGLEMIRAIRQRDRRTRFVILTCLDEFALAREAITQDVTGYILKLESDAAQIEETLSRALAQLSERDARPGDAATPFTGRTSNGEASNRDECARGGETDGYPLSGTEKRPSGSPSEGFTQRDGVCPSGSLPEGSASHGEMRLAFALDAVAEGEAALPLNVTRALDFVAAHLSENIGIGDAAAAVGLTSNHLGRLIARLLGASFTDVLNGARVERAKVLLLEPKRKVFEIAAQTGFTNTNYFIRVFKKHTGVTPMEFRNGGAL